MAVAKHSGAVKRFGARYGKRTRDRLAKIEVIAKATHKCPYCNYISVKKVSAGIFECKKCNSKFTGRAYQPLKKKTTKAVISQEVKFEGNLFEQKEKKVNEDEQLANEAAATLKDLQSGSEEETDELAFDQDALENEESEAEELAEEETEETVEEVEEAQEETEEAPEEAVEESSEEDDETKEN